MEKITKGQVYVRFLESCVDLMQAGVKIPDLKIAWWNTVSGLYHNLGCDPRITKEQWEAWRDSPGFHE